MNQIVKPNLSLIGPWPPPYGGVAIHVFQLFNNLKDDFAVQVFSYGKKKIINTHSFLKYIFIKPPLWLYSLHKLNFLIGPRTIVHNHSIINAYPKSFILTSFLKFINKKKILLIDTLHDQTLIKRFSSFLKEDQRALIDYWRRAKIIVTINPKLEFFVKNLGIEEEKIYTISPLLPFGINPKPFDTVDQFRSKHDVILSTTGAFNPFYDIETIIKAFLLIKKIYTNSGLIVVKCGFASDSKYEARIKFLLRKNKCNNDVLFLKDIPHENFLYVLKISNVFIRGAQEESFGLSKIESLILGTPVISTPTGQIQFVKTYLYGNIDDLKNKVIFVINNKDDITKAAKDFYQKMASDNLCKIKQLYGKIF